MHTGLRIAVAAVAALVVAVALAGAHAGAATDGAPLAPLTPDEIVANCFEVLDGLWTTGTRCWNATKYKFPWEGACTDFHFFIIIDHYHFLCMIHRYNFTHLIRHHTQCQCMIISDYRIGKIKIISWLMDWKIGG